MKKTLKILLLVVVVGVFIAGAGLFAYNSGVLAGNPNLSEAEAKSIAEEHVGGQAKSIHLEKEGMTSVYEVVVVTQDGTFEVEIDADSGKVLEVEPDDGAENDDDQDDDDNENDDEEDDDELHDDEEDDDDQDEVEQDNETRTI